MQSEENVAQLLATTIVPRLGLSIGHSPQERHRFDEHVVGRRVATGPDIGLHEPL